ncbi:hypothetical protein A9K61_04450 [Stenotrophomonas maltophilia]|nr:hypothetical protein A9K61_04450 [Stenotrophomonas maltophilia]
MARWVTVTVAVLSWGELTETRTGSAVHEVALPTQSPDHWMAYCDRSTLEVSQNTAETGEVRM